MPASPRFKVALIVYRDDPKSGGALRVGQMMAQHLPHDQVETHFVFAYGGPGAIADNVNVPTHFLEASSSRDWVCWRRTRQWFQQMHFDVLHFIDPVNWVYFATIGVPGKRIDHFHGCPIPETLAVHDQLIALVRRWLNDAGIAITYGAKRQVSRMGWMSPAKVHVVHNGVNLRQFEEMPDQAVAREQLKLPRDARLFGSVARLCEGNGVLEILEVLKRLPPQWHAVMVGDGPLRTQLEALAVEQGLDRRLHLTGAIGDVRPAYAALDAVVLLARYQPFCLMLAEAMLARVPVVGLQGAGEYTEPEYPLITARNAVFFPRADPWNFKSKEPAEQYQKVAMALQDVVNKPVETDKRVCEGVKWVKQRFSAERHALRCLDVYRYVLGYVQGLPCES